MDWSIFFKKILSASLTGFMTGIAGVVASPSVDINSKEAVLITSVSSVVLSVVTGITNYLKHK